MTSSYDDINNLTADLPFPFRFRSLHLTKFYFTGGIRQNTLVTGKSRNEKKKTLIYTNLLTPHAASQLLIFKIRHVTHSETIEYAFSLAIKKIATPTPVRWTQHHNKGFRSLIEFWFFHFSHRHEYSTPGPPPDFKLAFRNIFVDNTLLPRSSLV